MNHAFLLFVLLVYSCSQKDNQQSEKISSVSITTNDTIPLVRKQVSNSPVASYIIPINNPLLHQYFGVKVYETSQTFKFLLRMQYEGVLETDTLRVPNFGTWPIVEVNKGTEKMSCIIGFLDREKHFKEYKKLLAKDNKLKLLVLKRYGVGLYGNAK